MEEHHVNRPISPIRFRVTHSYRPCFLIRNAPLFITLTLIKRRRISFRLYSYNPFRVRFDQLLGIIFNTGGSNAVSELSAGAAVLVPFGATSS